MDNIPSPTLQFGRSNFDSALKMINNHLTGGSSRPLSFSDKGEFVLDQLQADRWVTKRTENLPDEDVVGEVPLHWHDNKKTWNT